MVITDGSNLFPLCGLEHQMVNVAGVALHHLGNGGEKQHVNKKGINTPPTVYGYAKQLNVSAALKKKRVRCPTSGERPEADVLQMLSYLDFVPILEIRSQQA